MSNPIGSDADLRESARKRLQARANAWRAAGGWAVLAVFFIVIWAVSGQGYFWPVWPIAGTGIALAFTFLSAYGFGSGGVSESRIDAEVERMRNRR